MDVKRATAIQSVRSTARATFAPVNVSAGRVSSDYGATPAPSISTVSLTTDARSASATRSVLYRFNATIQTVNADAEITSKVDAATGARRINTTVRLAVAIAHLATTWCKMLSMTTEPNSPNWPLSLSVSFPIQQSLPIWTLTANWPRCRQESISSGSMLRRRVAATRASVSSWKN